MKLYDFTYTDNQNLNESSLLSRVEAFVENEAVLQDWAPGYSLKQSRSPKQTNSGKDYFFEVVGKYLNTEGIEGDEVADVELFGATANPAAASESTI